MAYHTFYGGTASELIKLIREALPHNPKVVVAVTTYPHFEKKVSALNLKLKGIAIGNSGLIFTFENGIRHILEAMNEADGSDGRIGVTIKSEPTSRWAKKPPYKAQVKFVNHEGSPVTITLK